MRRLTRTTKVDFARIIVCALYNLTDLPSADDPRVVRMARRNKKTELDRMRVHAVKALSSRAIARNQS